jgi:hypothetical protein
MDSTANMPKGMDIGANELLMELLCEEMYQGLIACEDVTIFERETTRQLHDAQARLMGACFERLDQELFEQKDDTLKVHDFKERRLLTRSGQVTFRRRRYDSDCGSVYLLDETVGLLERTNKTPNVIARLSQVATQSSYEAAVLDLFDSSGVKISRKNVKEALAASAKELELSEVEKFPPAKKKLRHLDCESDDIVVPRQRSRAQKRAEQASGTNKNKAHITVTHAKHYEGKELLPGSAKGRKRCINPVHITKTTSSRAALEATAASIAERYDLDFLDCIHFGCDGAENQRIGADILPGQVKTSYDSAHVFKSLWAWLEEDVYKEVRSALYKDDIDLVQQTLNNAAFYYHHTQNSDALEKLQQAGRFIARHAEEIHRGLKHSLGTLEGSNAHIISDRCKGRGRAWSPDGARNITALRAAEASGTEIPLVKRRTSTAALGLAARKRRAEERQTQRTAVIDLPAGKARRRQPQTPVASFEYYNQAKLAPFDLSRVGHSWMYNLN